MPLLPKRILAIRGKLGRYGTKYEPGFERARWLEILEFEEYSTVERLGGRRRASRKGEGGLDVTIRRPWKGVRTR